MAVNLNIQAEVIDISNDTPRLEDIFLVDTNVWFWQTSSRPLPTTRPYPLTDYLGYLATSLAKGATLTYSGLTIAELSHIIEKTEYEIYKQSNPSIRLSLKEYRHNLPAERATVVAEVESCWNQVTSMAELVNLDVNDDVTKAALTRFKTQNLDGYDLLMLEAIGRAGAGQTKVITDDMDYSVVPGIQVFTRNPTVISQASLQGKLITR